MIVKADMHIHSLYSDGKASPLEIVLQASSIGLGVISITDHDTFAGSKVAVRYANLNTYGVIVVPGIEVRTDAGDILVYCVREVDLPRSIELLIDKAHEENCIVVPAHPFDITRLGVGDAIFRYKEWDAIEVWNASSTKGSNFKAIEAARILGKPGLANSDAHLLEELGVAFSFIELEAPTAEAVLEAIVRGRVKPVYGRRPLGTTLKRLSWSLTRSIGSRLREKD